MVGHDIVIHAAAQKHIPQAEADPINCYQTNVSGSLNVAAAAVQAGIKQALAISTDKAAYPMNAYGATKRLVESLWREYGRTWGDVTTFHLCRYGNVIGSNGSVVQVWQQQMAAGRRPTVTDLRMSRFWLSESQAVDIVLKALRSPNGMNVIPMAPALDMETFAQHILGDVEMETIGLRLGERMHEWLITPEEYPFCTADGDDAGKTSRNLRRSVGTLRTIRSCCTAIRNHIGKRH
jgi:UDP-N-acetylglucosamine 4,6-dehydratase